MRIFRLQLFFCRFQEIHRHLSHRIPKRSTHYRQIKKLICKYRRQPHICGCLFSLGLLRNKHRNSLFLFFDKLTYFYKSVSLRKQFRNYSFKCFYRCIFSARIVMHKNDITCRDICNDVFFDLFGC